MRLRQLLPSSVRTGAHHLKRAVLTATQRRRSAAALRRSKEIRDRQIDTYLSTHPVAKLQLGSGSNLLPGWLNTEGFVPSSFTHSQ